MDYSLYVSIFYFQLIKIIYPKINKYSYFQSLDEILYLIIIFMNFIYFAFMYSNVCACVLYRIHKNYY